jgi:hypothetical protein
MDIRTVRTRIERREYGSRQECIEDVRCIWSNAMLFNGLGSKVYTAAKVCSETFEEIAMKSSVMKREESALPSNEELAAFAEQCFRLSSEDLGKLLLLVS